MGFKTLDEMEKDYILNALSIFPNKTEAASKLGISLKTLYNKLHRYGMIQKKQQAVEKTEVTGEESAQRNA